MLTAKLSGLSDIIWQDSNNSESPISAILLEHPCTFSSSMNIFRSRLTDIKPWFIKAVVTYLEHRHIMIHIHALGQIIDIFRHSSDVMEE